jgi:opacity protein-like surface antigen
MAAVYIGIFMLVCAVTQAHSMDSSVSDTTELSFSVGYGQNFHIGTHGKNVSADVKYVPFIISWTKTFAKFSGSASMAYAFEGFLSYAKQEEEDRYLVGLTPFLIYNFKAYQKFVPYAEVGLGIAATNLDPKGFGGDFGFTPQAGFGVRYALSHHQFIRFSYRFHHISNAGLKKRNQSIDANFILIGYSFLF